MTSPVEAAASDSTVGQRSSHERYRGITRSTCVCWSMTSETRIAYGSRVRRQGRSAPWSRNQAASSASMELSLEQPKADYCKDVTDYSALFTSGQPYTISVPNYLGGLLTGVMHISASLTFYEPDASHP